MDNALINTVIAFKLMKYTYSLKSFFKDEFKVNEKEYLIPFSHVLYVKRNIFALIRDSCDYVCPCRKPCHGHKFLDFIKRLYQFQHHAVIEEKCYFANFRFYNFRFEKDTVSKMEVVAGWDFNYYTTKDLSHLSFSQRCRSLD